MSDSNIYLDTQGNYRDDTPENREAYPAAEDQTETPESGTLTQAGEDTGAQAPGADSGAPPVSPESEQTPPTDTARTRNQ